MEVKRFIGGSLESNGYVIYNKISGCCYIVDPGYDSKKITDFVYEKKLKAKGIILTHLHHDHTGASENLSDKLNCPIYMHESDTFVYKGRVDEIIKDGDVFNLEDEIMEVINTPGHTKGSICLMCRKSRICFTGDTLFDTDLGRSDLEGGSEEDMRKSVKKIIDKWENDITIYPGHDNGCTMKYVRKNNTEFLALRDGYER